MRPPPVSLDQALGLLREHAPPLAKALKARPELMSPLFEAGELYAPLTRAHLHRWLAPPERPQHRKPGEDEAALLRRLRRAKEAVFVHLGLRDLLGLADISEVTGTLTDLAEMVLREALEAGQGLLRAKKGLPPRSEGEPEFFAVLGLGKLGGRELNYASDVDVLYLHDPGLWPLGQRISAAEFADSLGAFVSQSLSLITADGFVFRVDLDLRPAGKDGAMAPSREAARHHYLYRAADWERLALLKLRPLAGNLSLGRELVEETRPFVFRRHLDYTALEELKELKARIAARPRSLTQRGFDLKLDKGGIRQLEFFVQTLQLIYGGRAPRTRAANTLEALDRLAEQGTISRRDRGELKAAYVFLRRVEHRLQLHNLQQTQTLPSDKETLDRLGRAMGYGEPTPGRDFSDDLQSHLDQVARRFEALLSGPAPRRDSRPLSQLLRAVQSGDEEAGLDILATLGFLEAHKALSLIKKLTDDAFLPHSLNRQRRLLAQILPALLDRVLASGDPDAALNRLETFLARIGPKTGLFLMLLENPPVLDLLVRLMATSAYLARVLSAHPGILDSLIDRRVLQVKDQINLFEELGELVSAASDEEERAAVIRRFKAEETIRIAVYDLTEELPLERVSDQLSDLAEVVVGETLLLAEESLKRRYSPSAEEGRLEFAVVGLGKLGGRELAYHSDLDVLFLHRAPEARPPGPGELDPNEYAVKLAQRLMSLLSAAMPEGPGYQIDARLRPSGRYGPLVVSLDSFVQYHQTSEVWERLALLKARPVAGSIGLAREAMEWLAQIVFGRELPRGWVEELRELRERMRRERGAAEGWDLKFGGGGLIDVEFAVQALQIYHGRRNEALRTPHTLRGLKAFLKSGLLEETTCEALYDGYRLLRRLDHRLRLIFDRSGDGVSYTDKEIKLAGFDPAALAETSAGIAEAYDEVMESL